MGGGGLLVAPVCFTQHHGARSTVACWPRLDRCVLEARTPRARGSAAAGMRTTKLPRQCTRLADGKGPTLLIAAEWSKWTHTLATKGSFRAAHLPVVSESVQLAERFTALIVGVAVPLQRF